MGITSSGVMCDVCGHYVFPIDPAERVHTFSCAGFDRDLHCDNACKVAVEAAFKAKDWKQLPAGPLREAFERQEAGDGK